MLSSGVRACSSVAELLQYVPQESLTALRYPSKQTYVVSKVLSLITSSASLEEEASTGYTEVTMRQAHEMRMPVTMEVADTHVRVTSVCYHHFHCGWRRLICASQIRAAVISPNLSCKSTEIISLADVSDAYNVSTGLDPYEFIIRRSKQGVTSYFSSPQRDSIVKVRSR
jgi:neurofibromin 1